jgi:hypothetical protein
MATSVKLSMAALAVCALIGSQAVSPVFAQPSEVRVQVVNIHQTKNPRGIEDYVRDIGNSPIGREAVGAAAAYFGIDPDAAKLAVQAAAKLIKTPGEEIYLDIPTDPGFTPCSAKFTDVSRTGRGAIGITQRKDALAVYIWLQRRGVGKGRSWVETDVTLYAVPEEEYADLAEAGKCTRRGDVLFQRKW